MSEALDNESPFWLTGNFAPTFTEHTETELRVTGSIPPELNGRYLRNGANPESGESVHWFAGNGMIHGVELANGKANWYRNRYVRTPALPSTSADGTEDPRTQSLANTHIISHAGKILALEELHWPYELSPTLETIGPHTYGGKLETGMTAHPKVCPETGELLFFSYGIVPPYLTYHRANAAGELVQSEVINVKGGTMVHDFNITRNHVIFMDLPVVWDLEKVAEGGLPLEWSDDYGARLGVMPRNGTNADVVWYDIEPCYVYHPMNAYENGDEIVLDVCRMEHHMRTGSPDASPHLHQWTINTKTKSVSERQLGEHVVEFPRVASSRVGLKHRYGYTADFNFTNPAVVAVAFRKYDFQTGESQAHVLPSGCQGSEPEFVPAANGSSEDDGYLMSFVTNNATQTTDLLILDASNITAEPIAKVHLPVLVPAGFHGSWVPDA